MSGHAFDANDNVPPKQSVAHRDDEARDLVIRKKVIQYDPREHCRERSKDQSTAGAAGRTRDGNDVGGNENVDLFAQDHLCLSTLHSQRN